MFQLIGKSESAPVSNLALQLPATKQMNIEQQGAKQRGMLPSICKIDGAQKVNIGCNLHNFVQLLGVAEAGCEFFFSGKENVGEIG